MSWTPPPGMDENTLSRILNSYFGGDPSERFSARVYRDRWTAPRWFALWIILDAHFWRERGERWHCRTAWLEDARPTDFVERFRRVEGG